MRYLKKRSSCLKHEVANHLDERGSGHSAERHRCADGKAIAILIFKPDSETLPPQYQGGDGIYRVFYHRRGLSDVIDLLRNERPLAFHYWLPDGHNTCIASHGSELVGEGE